MSDVRTVPVPEGLAGERIDAALSRMLGLSRSRCSELIEDGHILLDGQRPPKSVRLVPGSVLEITLPAPQVPVQPASDMDVLYDDQDLVVINKPVGVAAHTGPGWSGPTVLASLEAMGVRISTSGPPERKGIVQRLDVGTSGAMMVAKSELAYSRLKHAFRERTVEKIYHAVVEGHPDPPRGTIDAPIGRHPSRQWRMAIIDKGKPARTHYDVLELMPGASLIEVDLETGRTHQIRVHMAALHHPCVGDVFYGADPVRAKALSLERQWLHAREVTFKHPRTEELVRVVAPYPKDLESSLALLRGQHDFEEHS